MGAVDDCKQFKPPLMEKFLMLPVYSGKKMRHTMKTQIATNKERLIVQKARALRKKNIAITCLRSSTPQYGGC